MVSEPVVVSKPLVGTGECNNTILCINCVFVRLYIYVIGTILY